MLSTNASSSGSAFAVLRNKEANAASGDRSMRFTVPVLADTQFQYGDGDLGIDPCKTGGRKHPDPLYVQLMVTPVVIWEDTELVHHCGQKADVSRDRRQ
jgi:hypothetical protein